MERPIFPFLWMRGEEESILRREIGKIAECGIRAVCVEARPHDDFCGPGWWRDMDIVLDEAKKRDMRIWILDDKHFPTGYANGLIESKYPERKKQYLACTVADVFGSACERTLNVGRMLKPSIGFWEIGNPVDYAERANNRLLALTALRFEEDERFHEDAINWNFAPMIDAARDSRWGRVSEGPGQDPCLVSRFARAKIRGLQNDRSSVKNYVAACTKHYVAYGACESGRDYNTTSMTNCPQCPRHCPSDALSCGRGRVFFGQESSMQEGHEEHEHRGFDHPHPHGERGHHAKPDLETLEGLLSACGHILHHNRDKIFNFTILTFNEQETLKELLGKLI